MQRGYLRRFLEVGQEYGIRPSSSVSEDDDEEDENASVGEYSGDDRLLELGGDGGVFGGS